MPTPRQFAWLKEMVPYARDAQRIFGVPASITLAQAILESGWGESKLAVNANNLFGIKARIHMTPNDYVEFPTVEYSSGKREVVDALFAQYPTPRYCFLKHAELLDYTARYRRCREAAPDVSKYALALQVCGYSTNPNYAQQLLTLIRELHLTEYDAPPPQNPSAALEVA